LISKGNKIALAALAIIVVIVAAVAVTGIGKVISPQATVTDFFSDYSNQDYEAAMAHTVVSKMGESAQQSYVIYLEAQGIDETVTINHMTDVTDGLSTEAYDAVSNGMTNLAGVLGIVIDDWTALYVNMTENKDSISTQVTSSFYLLVVHCDGGWYLEPTSFQTSTDNWITVYT
jgi:hypothetical protein